MSQRIQCSDCWLVHGAEKTDCFLEWAELMRSEQGRAELKQRQRAAYARHGAAMDANTYAEAWRWAQKAGVPYEALRALREGPEESVALSSARQFNRDSAAVFLLLLGPPGVGKTLAASLAAVDFASKWDWNGQPTGSVAPIRYVDSASLTRLSAYETEEKRYVEALRNCRLLVLEEAGDEGTDLGRGLFVELLKARGDAGRRTVVTSNLRPDAFRSRYTDAVADRIRTGGYMPNLFGEKSRRVRRAA